METVLVTGASGFIASHIVHQLLACREEGNGGAKYRVRGTVMPPDLVRHRAMLLEMAAGLSDDAAERLEVVAADLLEDNGWKEAVDGCCYVVHTASPVPADVPDSAEVLVRPAVQGTERVLQACQASPSVKRVVMTSSNSAISGSEPSRAHKSMEHVFTEEDWTDPDLCPPYERSKNLAERRAWELWQQIPEQNRFELVVINPVYVLGPLVMSNPGSSMLLITKTMSGGFIMYPGVYPTLVDVRDVARVHVAAMTKPGISGNRFLVSGERGPEFSMPDIARILYDEFSPQGFSFSTRRMPGWLAYPLSFFIKELTVVIQLIDVKVKYDQSKTIETFGIEYTPIRQCIVDAGRSCIEHGVVAKP